MAAEGVLLADEGEVRDGLPPARLLRLSVACSCSASSTSRNLYPDLRNGRSPPILIALLVVSGLQFSLLRCGSTWSQQGSASDRQRVHHRLKRLPMFTANAVGPGADAADLAPLLKSWAPWRSHFSGVAPLRKKRVSQAVRCSAACVPTHALDRSAVGHVALALWPVPSRSAPEAARVSALLRHSRTTYGENHGSPPCSPFGSRRSSRQPVTEITARYRCRRSCRRCGRSSSPRCPRTRGRRRSGRRVSRRSPRRCPGSRRARSR